MDMKNTLILLIWGTLYFAQVKSGTHYRLNPCSHSFDELAMEIRDTSTIYHEDYKLNKVLKFLNSLSAQDNQYRNVQECVLRKNPTPVIGLTYYEAVYCQAENSIDQNNLYTIKSLSLGEREGNAYQPFVVNNDFLRILKREEIKRPFSIEASRTDRSFNHIEIDSENLNQSTFYFGKTHRSGPKLGFHCRDIDYKKELFQATQRLIGHSFGRENYRTAPLNYSELSKPLLKTETSFIYPISIDEELMTIRFRDFFDDAQEYFMDFHRPIQFPLLKGYFQGITHSIRDRPISPTETSITGKYRCLLSRSTDFLDLNISTAKKSGFPRPQIYHVTNTLVSELHDPKAVFNPSDLSGPNRSHHLYDLEIEKEDNHLYLINTGLVSALKNIDVHLDQKVENAYIIRRNGDGKLVSKSKMKFNRDTDNRIHLELNFPYYIANPNNNGRTDYQLVFTCMKK
jgi:hypothetical protein